MFANGKRVAMFPENISESQTSLYKLCPTKWFYKNAMCLRSGKTSIHLNAGKIISEAMEEARTSYFISGLSAAEAAEQAIIAATDKTLQLAEHSSNKNPAKVKQVLQRYFQVFPLDLEDEPYLCEESGQVGIEHSLLAELPFLHPETGKPLMFKGKLDFVTKSETGQLRMIDEKSTSYLDRDLAKEINKLRTAGQFLGYAWLGKQNDINLSSCEIRKLVLTNRSVDAVPLQYAITDFAINSWCMSTLQIVKSMVDSYKELSERFSLLEEGQTTDYLELLQFPQNFSTGCNAFNTICEFSDGCLSPAGYALNKAKYSQIAFDATTREEVPMSEFKYKEG